MVMEKAERRAAERISGVSNLTYDLVALLHEKLEAITVYEIYKQDAREAGHNRAMSLFEHCQETDRALVQRLRRLLAEEFGAMPVRGEELDENGTPVDRGGDLSPLKAEEVVDEASEDSFPASDPPSYSGTTA